ncbi:complex I intermediate-associated protein 84, mitochondrial precursor [Lindgomyces ingoldianus]|uniref:Complex I intermediate-associated protein 84, mitochondrial n=1 Tax=Lindgomyces ingoldianus TaxID=673940 RepID=A0ACB6REV2_9PLEO|nr:complex I intermediate-associated protein 84, mitochondrial precursor [Lindgomyces ingoldianus]KAF2477779.1 complex I intermediate-associated protein 84, mitochondrial precursor [Lindgomyces ingoldianus]
MPSHLTRLVFRSIIANRPVLYRGCVHSPPSPRTAASFRNGWPTCQQRGFLNLFKPARKIKDPDVPPGLGTLLDLAHMQSIAARPPPPSDVAQALNIFFTKYDKKPEDFHLRAAMNAYNYIQATPKSDGQPWMSAPELLKILRSLRRRAPGSGKASLAFARLLHEELNARQKAAEPDLAIYQLSDLPAFLNILCLNGAALEARELAATTLVGPITPDTPFPMVRAILATWTYVLKGFSREQNQEGLLQTVDIIRRLSVPFTPNMQQLLVAFFVQKADFEQAKHWYLQPTATPQGLKDIEPNVHTHALILKACALDGDPSFGQQVVASLLKDLPTKAAWDAIFLWSAAIGKGVDEVDRMMNVMVRRNDEWRREDPARPVVCPDIDTINALVELCMSRKDPYSAERYIALGEKRGILPNAKTYCMQIAYRLSANDIDGARAAYYGLQGEQLDDQSTEVVNKLIQAMCGSKRHHFDDVMAVVDDLHERKAQFVPQTIAMLCTLHLQRGESDDAVDLLQIHTYHYAPEQRAIISGKLAEFIMNRDNSTADAWDTYQILRQVFQETPRHVRVRLMNEFFARRRSDMACHIFFHMRNHASLDVRPDGDAYATVFTGFARNADAESLELIHNQLKLDLNVELDTKLRNSLMLAYAATGNNRRALEFWAEIVASKEGPTYRSIAIAFRSCEGMPWGDQHAKPIWRRLKEMDIDVDKEIWTAYLCAIARNQLHDEAVQMLETVEEEYGFTPDLYILSNWFNTTTNSERQRKVEAWIRQRYPAVWTEMEGLGHYKTMDGFGYRQFHINRDLDP